MSAMDDHPRADKREWVIEQDVDTGELRIRNVVTGKVLERDEEVLH